MKLTADLSVCNGYGNCVMEAPEVLTLDDASGMVVVLDESPDESLRAKVEAAVRVCPVQALTLKD